MILRLLPLLFLFTACTPADRSLELASGWKGRVIAEWRDSMPDMLLLDSERQLLYVSCETAANLLAPSLARIDLKSGNREILLYGLARADGLKMAADGSLWLGEEVPGGAVWRIGHPHLLPPGQRIDRDLDQASHPDLLRQTAAGRMAHEGLAFSGDGRFLYLADEWSEGCLFRLELASGALSVLTASGWVAVSGNDTRIEAERKHGRLFDRIEDLERLPDGRIALAETGNGDAQGRVLLLSDGDTPTITTLIADAGLHHPDNLEWDAARRWLWISDDDSPSQLLAWDGTKLMRMARSETAEITGVESGPDGAIYLNLQHARSGPDMTLQLRGPKLADVAQP